MSQLKQAESIPNSTDPISTPETKKQNSYTYWVDKNNKSRELPPEQRPQKIDPQKLVSNQPKEQGRSTWNTAGTWEPKKISIQEIQKKYVEAINTWAADALKNFKANTIKVEGQCELVFIRNKKALTYEITGKVQFQKMPQKEEEVPEEAKIESEKEETTADSEAKNGATEEKSKALSKQKKKAPKKAKNMVFQITDLTDTGDRDFTHKADDVEDKKLIKQHSETLMQMLEEIIKAYKN